MVFFANFFLLVSAVVTGSEPSTLGWWFKCSTTVLPLQKLYFKVFYQFLSPGASIGDWTWPLNHGIVRQVFYHCATTTNVVFQSFFYQFLSPGASSDDWTFTLKHGKCSTIVVPLPTLCFDIFVPFVSLLVSVGPEPSTLEWWGDCSTIMLFTFGFY